MKSLTCKNLQPSVIIKNIFELLPGSIEKVGIVRVKVILLLLKIGILSYNERKEYRILLCMVVIIMINMIEKTVDCVRRK